VAWIFCYPQKGKLISLPDDSSIDRPDYVLAVINYVHVGTVYESRASCGDAVSCLIVSASTNKECEERVHLAYNWFENHVKWEQI